MKHQVYNKGFFTKFEYFSQYEILISLECAVDCEQIGIINYVVSCSIVGMKIHKNSGFSGLILHKTTLLEICIQLVYVKTALKISVNLCHYIIVCIKVPLPFTVDETFLSVCSHRTLIYDDASCV